MAQQGLGLYPVPQHAAAASQAYQQASGTYAGMDQARPEPEKSAAGAMQSGASMGVAGARMGNMVNSSGIYGTASSTGNANMALQDVSTGRSGGQWGAIAGVGVGLGSYLMS